MNIELLELDSTPADWRDPENADIGGGQPISYRRIFQSICANRMPESDHEAMVLHDLVLKLQRKISPENKAAVAVTIAESEFELLLSKVRQPGGLAAWVMAETILFLERSLKAAAAKQAKP